MIILSNKILLFLSLLLIYTQCDLLEVERLVLEELSDEWGVELNDCSSEFIECCNGNTAVCKLYVYYNICVINEEYTLLQLMSTLFVKCFVHR